MVSRRAILFAAVVSILALAAPSWAFAQGAGGGLYTGRSDNPNGPTVSPYLNLLNNNNQLNGLPTYQSLVRPLVDQRDAIQRQGSSLQNLKQQVNAQGAGGAGVGRGTGVHSQFMYYSHFYPARQAR